MRSRQLLAAAALALALTTTPIWAAEPMMDATPSRAAREKMAKAHAQMAECLRSEKPMSECQAAMKAAHDSAMGTGMGMGMGKGCGKMSAPAKPEDAAAHSPH